MTMPLPRRITICPIEATNNYGELTSFEVDAATTSLRNVVERIHADPMLHCKQVRVGTRLLTYEDDVTGDPIDMFNPAVGLEPLAAIVPHLLPRAAANGVTEFAEGQELWLVVDGCATEAEAITHIGSALLLSRFDAIERRRENAAVRTMLEAIGSMNARAAPDAACSALEIASERGRTDVARCLMGLIPVPSIADAPSSASNTKSIQGYDAVLHHAASKGLTHTARLLVKELGANAHAADRAKSSPLHVAASKGHTESS